MQERWEAQWRPVLNLARVGGSKEQVGAGRIPGHSSFVRGAHRCSRLADGQGQAQHHLAFAGTGQFDFRVLSASYVSLEREGEEGRVEITHISGPDRSSSPYPHPASEALSSAPCPAGHVSAAWPSRTWRLISAPARPIHCTLATSCITLPAPLPRVPWCATRPVMPHAASSSAGSSSVRAPPPPPPRAPIT